MSKQWLGTAILVLAVVGSTAWADVAATPMETTITDPITAPVNAETVTTITLGSTTGGNYNLDAPGCTNFTLAPDNVTIPIAGTRTVQVGYKATAVTGGPDCTFTVTGVGALDGDTTFLVHGRGAGPQLDVAPAATLALGNARVLGAASTSGTLVVSNGGTSDLVVMTATLGGANAGDFAIDASLLPVTIPASGTITLPVTFTPSAAGARTATATITSDDPVAPTEVRTLTGTGTNAVITVGDVAFGSVNAGDTASGAISVANTAAAPVGTLTVASAAISGSAWFTFNAGNGCATNLTTCAFVGVTAPPTRAVSVKCAPPAGATGTQTATVAFTSDSDAGGDASATLTCTAGVATATVNPTSLAFTPTRINTDSANATITVKNEGNIPLLYGIAKTDGAPAQFTIVSGCVTACTLAPSATDLVVVKFHPTTTGPKTATLTLTSNDPTSPITIPLMGTGTAPQASPSAALAFSTVEVGKTSPGQMVVITNTGNATLAITSAVLGGASASSYAVTAGNAGAQTLMPGLSAMWTLVCAPQTFGALPASFVVTSDSGGTAGTTTSVALTCTGQQGVLTLASPSTFDFGGVAAGESVTHAFTLTNTGNVAVAGITATFSNAAVGYTVLSPTFPLALASGASQTVVVKFAPATGADGGPVTLTFKGDWGVTPTATMAVATLDGDGLTAGFDVTPPLVQFGDIRFDTTPIRTFCIVNTGQAPVNIQSLAIALTGATVTGEVKILDLRRRACNATTTVPAIAYPLGAAVTLAPTETVEARVQVDPADRLGAIGATITVVSDLAVDPTRMTTIAANSITAMLTTTPGLTVEFGATDLDEGPQTKTVTIKNTGTAVLDLTGFARTGSPAFTFTLPTNTALPAGMQIDIDITYTPTLERPATQPDAVILSHSITGVLNGPSMQMITVQGHGVDRHIALGAAPVFPATFRNPGSMAPVRNVVITNTGDADLRISAAMVTNPEVWQLLETNPVTIPGQGSHDFPIRFVPTFAGKAPVGQLVFTNNDNTSSATAMAMLLLDGDGLDRQVTILGDPVNIGYTGIGIPISLDDGLVVQSMDATNPFLIRQIEIVDETGQFSIDNAPANTEIPPSTSLAFGVTFTPTEEGEFIARARLYLDEDPTQAAEVQLKATAVFVDAGGGGGCATGTGGGAGMVLVVGALLAARRRRTLGLVAATAAALVPAAAAADGAPLELDLSLFAPTPTTVGTTLQVQSADVGKDGAWVASATLTNASNPLVLHYGGGDHASISRRTTVEIGGAYAFLDRFEAGLRLPLYNQTGEEAAVGVASPTGTAVGDLVVHGRARLLDTGGDNRVVVGASLAVTLPTASEQQFAGVDKPSARVLALAQLTPAALQRRLTVFGNIGGVVRAKSEFSNIAQGSGLAFGAAASVRVLDSVWAFGEIYGDVLPGARKASVMEDASSMTTSEWLAGVSVRPDRRMAIGVAGGRGLVAGIGTPDVRVVLSLAFTPGRDAPPPIHAPEPPRPDGDVDGDGVRDSADACPQDVEDRDGFQDADGCPELDNDADGLADAGDQCPFEAEDKDGFEDRDGCPDLDNDTDGVADALDKCPLDAEDKDGFEDADGCPDRDNDRDGVADALDRCPAQPETINGKDDDDGCPDKGDTSIVLTPSAIEMLDAIVFSGPRLAKASTSLLGQVAATLRAHPEILRVRVTVHVDPGSDAKKDQALTDARAQAIREWLIKWGIDSERVQATGFGGTRPLVPKKSPINDRVEIIILEKK